MKEVFWIYQCPDPDCGLIGLLHDYEYTTRPTPAIEGSWVPCPRCHESMSKLRKANDQELENPIRLTRYSQYGATFRIPIGLLMNPSPFPIEPDSSAVKPQKRRVKTSIKAFTHGLLRAEQVSEILGISIQAVRQAWRDNQLGYVQLNKKQRLSSKEQIEDYLRSKTSAAASIESRPPAVQAKSRQLVTPMGTSREDVRKTLSTWDECSRQKSETDKA